MLGCRTVGEAVRHASQHMFDFRQPLTEGLLIGERGPRRRGEPHGVHRVRTTGTGGDSGKLKLYRGTVDAQRQGAPEERL